MASTAALPWRFRSRPSAPPFVNGGSGLLDMIREESIGPGRQPAPLFICGNARGGTTLLVWLLDGHPDLFVLPTETQIYPVLATRPPARWLLRVAELTGWRRGVALLANPALARFSFAGRQALADRLRLWAGEYSASRTLADGAIDAAALRVHGPHEYWYAFLDVFSQFSGSALEGKRYWVEKTPGAERFAPVSDVWCGRACRFLHVIRDPRDFVASTLLRRTRLRGVAHRGQEIVGLCSSWSRSLTWCLHGLRTLPGRYHALRYEDMVHDPGGTMEAVCALLGIPMHANLLTPTRMGEQVRLNSSDLSAAGSPGEVVTSRVGRFAESFTTAELATIERLLGAQMEACGYLPSGTSVHASGLLLDEFDPDARNHPRTRRIARRLARRQAAWRGSTVPFIGSGADGR